MSSTALRVEIESLSDNERRNLATILELDEQSSPEQICESVRWMYWSRTRAKLTGAIGQTWTPLKSKRGKEQPNRAKDESYPVDLIGKL